MCVCVCVFVCVCVCGMCCVLEGWAVKLAGKRQVGTSIGCAVAKLNCKQTTLVVAVDNALSHSSIIFG